MSEEQRYTSEVLDEEDFPVLEQLETEDTTDKGKKFTFSSKKEYKKHIKGEKARQKAIEKARATYQPLEDELQAEKERTKRISEGETVEPRQKKSFCERHPRACKVGKGVAVAGAAVGTAALVGAAAMEGAGEALGSLALGGSRKEPSRPSKTKSAPKRTASTPKRKTTSQKARKPTQKRSAASKAGKSTPKSRTTSQSKSKAVPQNKGKSPKATATKKSPKKPKRPRNDDWWGYGDAGLF